MKINYNKNLIWVTVVVLLFFLLGVYTGKYVLRNYHTNSPLISTSSADMAVKANDLSEFWDVWGLLEERYPFTEPSIENKIDGAMVGLADSYDDRYTKYFPPEDAKIFKEEIDGSFAGVGIEIDIKDGFITVVAPLDGTPGYNAGILAGDVIYKIDEVVTTDLSIEQAVKLIRGEPGTDVLLTVLRKDEIEPLPIKITRAQIHIPIIKVSNTDDGIRIIRLISFTHTSAQEFTRAIMEAIKDGHKGVIIDLRNNPGGILDEAVTMANVFIPEDTVIVSENEGDIITKEYKTRRKQLVSDEFKIVVLVNHGSASAAEILAGALQDYGRAVIVGETTFGKGSVQELIDVGKRGGALKVTVAHWLTPLGRTINETGLDPDIMVTMSSDDIKTGNDVQLEEAVIQLHNLVSK